MAVVTALIIVAVVAALTTGLFMRQTAAVRQVENEAARTQARWVLAGGLDWARLVVLESLRREPIVHDGQLWAVPLLDTPLQRPGDQRVATFSGTIDDEQGKFNLYNVAQGGAIVPDQLATLQRLLALLGANDTLAARLAQQVQLSQPVKAVTDPQGNIVSQEIGPRAPAPRGLEDMLAVLRIDEPLRSRLQATLTMLPAATQVNVNTAPPEVIAALLPGMSVAQARVLLSERDRGVWFRDSADFGNRVTGTGLPVAPPEVSATSAWFMATGTVAYERARVGLRALIQSPDGRSTNIVWKREVD
jgi:general secretion pathway protein K